MAQSQMADYSWPLIMFHVFTNGRDHFTTDEAEARQVYARYLREERHARLYVETYEDEDAYDSVEPEEECIRAFGEFPT